MVGIRKSEQFHKILKSLEENFITGFINHLSEDTISFIDIDSEESISFVSETKIMNVYNRDFKDKMEFKDFFYGKDSEVLWQRYRTKLKIGRYINRLLVDEKNKETLAKAIINYKDLHDLSDREFPHLDRHVEIFVNNYKALYRRATDKGLYDNIEFVSGESIRHWYSEKNYAGEFSRQNSDEEYRKPGTLGKSCMRHEHCQDYLDIYVDNPSFCKLMIYKQDDKISMRALLWTLPDGSKYLDRIYSLTEADAIIFMNYAKEQGWDYFDKEELVPDIYVRIPLIYEEYPYMDTFKYLSMRTHKCYSRHRPGTYELEGQDGEFEKADIIEDEY